jgi:hypothetical protein
MLRWCSGLRITSALDLAESNLDPSRGSQIAASWT